MTQSTTTRPALATPGAAQGAGQGASPATTVLLASGAVAGPLFVAVAFMQVLTRDGFDLRHHPLSLLSLGALGWIQIANFVLTGGLYVAGAVGMRRAMPAGRGRVWGPRLIGVFGGLLVWAGVFVADPAAGFPPGTPARAEAVSWHGVLHDIAPGFAFLVLAAACLVFARRFAAERRRGWVLGSVATLVGLFTPDLFLGRDWFTVVLALAAAVGWCWASLVAGRLLADTVRAR